MKRHGTPSFSELLRFAHELADRSGDIVRPHFRKPIAVENKGPARAFDPVTEADRAAERALDRLIRSRFPDHGVLGEEFGARGEDARHRWIIDPIDGTRGFITGMPTWGTLIGLLEGEEPVLGIMDQPYTGERFWSSKRSAHARSADGRTRRLKTRGCARLSAATVMTTCPDLFANGNERETFERLKRETRLVRYSGDCYAYCMLAGGFVDLVIEAGLKPHDIVALIPIVERAGGRVTTWDGEPATSGGRILAAGDPALHARVLKSLSG